MIIKRRSINLLVLCLFISAATSLFFPRALFAGAMQDLKDFFQLPDWQGIEANLGPVKIKPVLSNFSEYNSNINLTNGHKKQGMIYRITPGITIQAPLDRLYFETGADLSFVIVEADSQEWTGSSRGIARYDFSDTTSLGLKELYSRGFTYGFIPGNRYDLDRTYLDLKHQFSPRLAVTLGGERERYETHVKNGYGLHFADYKEGGGGLAVSYKLTPTTSLALNSSFANRLYEHQNQKDYNGWTNSLGVAQKITPNISVGANMGFQYRDYKFVPDAREMTYGGNIDMILSAFSTLSIYYNRGLADTLYPRDPNALTYPFEIDRTLNYFLNEEYRYVETNRIGLALTYRLTEQDTLDIGWEYIKSKSGDSQVITMPGDTYLLGHKLKEYNYYSGIGYMHKFLPWLSVNLRGSYGARTSNVREKYDYYTATGGLTLAY